MHRLIYCAIALITFSCIVSCNNRCGKKNADDKNITVVDSLMRRLSVALYSSPDSVASLCDSIIQHAEASDTLRRAYASTVLAVASLVKGDNERHDSLFASARIIADSKNTPPLFREFYFRTLGISDNLKGNNEEACENTSKALAAAVASGNHMLVIENEAALGEFNQILGRLPEAAAHMRRAIALADSSGYVGQRSFFLNLADLYSSMGNYAEADRYFALHRESRTDYPVYTNFFYHSTLGNSMYFRGRYTDAADCFRKALEIISTTGDPFLNAMTLVNLGESLMLAGNIDSAARYINDGTGRFESIGVHDQAQIYYLKSLKGALALRQGNIDKARALLENIDNEADTTQIPPRYRALHLGRLADLYTATGEYKKALSSTIEKQKTEMKLFDRSTRQYASELEYRYMQDTIVLNSRVLTAHKQEEVLRLRTTITTVTAIALAITLALCIYSALQTYRRRRLTMNMRASLLSMRLENTRNRITPHFVFNMLDNTLNGNSSPDQKEVEKFVNLIRRNLQLAEQPVIALKEELEFVDSYVDFLRHPSGTSFLYHKNIDINVDTNMLVPSMLVEIFVENAIKHGLRGYEGRRELWLDISRTQTDTVITVANNGLMQSPATSRGTGTGTRIVSQTIQMLNEHNSKKITMSQYIKDRSDTDGGKIYIVSIAIPHGFDFSVLADKNLLSGK